MIIKFFDPESMKEVPLSRWTTYLLAAGLYWAAGNGADIISLSASFDLDFPAVRTATKFCWDRNIPMITAMTNAQGPGRKGAFFPAAFPWTIAGCGVE